MGLVSYPEPRPSPLLIPDEEEAAIRRDIDNDQVRQIFPRLPTTPNKRNAFFVECDRKAYESVKRRYPALTPPHTQQINVERPHGWWESLVAFVRRWTAPRCPTWHSIVRDDPVVGKRPHRQSPLDASGLGRAQRPGENGPPLVRFAQHPEDL